MRSASACTNCPSRPTGSTTRCACKAVGRNPPRSAPRRRPSRPRLGTADEDRPHAWRDRYFLRLRQRPLPQPVNTMSMLLPPFQLHEPNTIQEAVAVRARHPDSDFLAGGTDLLPNYKWQLNAKPHVISLHRIADLRSITPTR